MEKIDVENRCVCCGAIIPEGRQVCPNCMEDMETTKESKRCENVDELKELIANILKEVSKFHPNYPVYGYDYMDGKLVSVIKEPHEYL